MWSIQTNIEEPVPGCAGWVNLEISGMPSGPECLRIVPDWPNWRSASRSLSRWGGDQNNCNSYNSKDNINPKVIWTWRCISTVERRVASIIIMLREDPLSLMRSAFFFCGGGLPKPIQLPRVIALRGEYLSPSSPSLQLHITYQQWYWSLNACPDGLGHLHPLLEPEFNRSKSPICAALDSDRRTPSSMSGFEY